MRSRVVLASALAFTLLGCPKSKTDERTPPKVDAKHDAAHSDEPEHEELPKRVRLTKQVITDAKIQTAVAVKETLAVTLSLPGEIAADPDRSARVASPVAGRITDVRFKRAAP